MKGDVFMENKTANVIPAAPAQTPGIVKKVRYDWLDVLRAFAIILVILGHQAGNGIYLYASFSSHLKLSLFFAVSGFLFSKKKVDNPKEFFKNKIFRLLLPYLYLAVIAQTLTMLPQFINDPSLILQYPLSLAKMLLHGDILWFVPSLFLTEIIMFVVLKITKKNDKALIWLACLSLIAGFFALTPGKNLPFRVNALFVIWPIFVFGYLFRDYINPLDKKIKLYAGLISAGVFCLGLCTARAVFGQWIIMNINDSIYNNYLINIFLMFAGTLASFLLIQFIPLPEFMKSLGRNTLFYYAFHNQMCSFVMIMTGLILNTNVDKTYLRENRILWFAVVVIAMLLMITPCYAVNKFAPFMVGKKMTETDAVWLRTKKYRNKNK